MELRELRYFLTVAKEESISKAAQALYITQPNLSRQMQNLERELGCALFIRGSRKVTLTEEGSLLRKRAEEILELYEKTESDLRSQTGTVGGDIYIGGGESYAVCLIARTAKRIRDMYPLIKFHFFSGDTFDVKEKLDKGLVDFGIFVEPADLSGYEHIRLPLTDKWGVLMRKDDELAKKGSVTPTDLKDLPLIRSKHSLGKNMLTDWFGEYKTRLNVAATYNLVYNASLLVEAGIGYAIGLDKLINTTGESSLCFRPLSPRLETHLDFVWKRDQVLSKAAGIFADALRTDLTATSSE